MDDDFPHGRTAQRPAWAELPPQVRGFVEGRLGRRVVEASSQGGGFTQGFASRLRLDDGSRVFLKAVPRQIRSLAPAYRQEALVSAALPDAVPAPRLLWWDEDGDWIVLAFADVEGRIAARPWPSTADLEHVLAVLPSLASALTPAPPGLPGLQTTADLDPEFSCWRQYDRGDVDPTPVPAAFRHRVGELAALESEWAALAAGDTASHFDLRADNMLLTPDGDVLVCDWNWLALTAPWVDLVYLLVEVGLDGGDSEGILRAHPLGRDVAPHAVDCFLAALAGTWTVFAGHPPWPASPFVRLHQARNRDASLAWLDTRLARRSAR